MGSLKFRLIRGYQVRYWTRLEEGLLGFGGIIRSTECHLSYFGI